ncbi:conserved hypothetical protein [Allomeiothermus silvanus DSM 9946]|uniref:Uncharacterized protein n=1 Tax=Allomeiothermus silvanus (strain ATCC 700542 / DSM 9946 / NBRC 106475 / NCIMB 13440 / VI-R2) TaxID=526227 RepID=D7BI21_ALLS1|nr:hypothetical protein [Allomeiothermus silvanus]ADH62295.1 conserved hypothetical protein [Allomeiothermus silvanus DSM 9946]
MVRWSEVESRIELNELPHFHRAFLKLHRPELQADALPLRRVQQYVTQTLFQLVKSGQAQREEAPDGGVDFLVEEGAIPGDWRSKIFPLQ